jgi:hypothetical protein
MCSCCCRQTFVLAMPRSRSISAGLKSCPEKAERAHDGRNLSHRHLRRLDRREAPVGALRWRRPWIRSSPWTSSTSRMSSINRMASGCGCNRRPGVAAAIASPRRGLAKLGPAGRGRSAFAAIISRGSETPTEPRPVSAWPSARGGRGVARAACPRRRSAVSPMIRV